MTVSSSSACSISSSSWPQLILRSMTSSYTASQCVSTVPPECYALRLAPYVLVGLHDVETEVGDLLHRVAVVLGLRRQHLQQQSTQLALQLVTLLSISLVGVP
jgi:hypothetical protein